MRVAMLMAERSTCSSRVSVGAVFADTQGRIIATGYNGSPRGHPHCNDVGCLTEGGHCIRTIHAEENCILQCAVRGVSTVGLIAYTTHHPCERCEIRLLQAGIAHVYYLHDYNTTWVPDGLEVTKFEWDKMGVLA